MTTSVYGYQNAIKTATVASYSSAQPGLDPTQWQTNDAGAASMAWQSIGITPSVTFTTAAPTTFGVFVVSRSNLTSSATWRIQIWSDAARTARVFDSGTIGMAVANGQSVFVMPTAIVGQAFMLQFGDGTNPDGFVNIALAYAGPLFRPAGSISWATTRGRDQQVDEVVTRSGVEFPQFRWSRRRWSIDCQSLRVAELPTWQSLDAYARTGGNVLFVPDPSSATINADSIFGRLTPKADIGYPLASGDRLSWKADATERL